MYTFPATIVDNFFNNPDDVRDYALSLPFNSDPEGRWPGERVSLSETNITFFDFVCRKMLSLFTDDDYPKYYASAYFQKIKTNEYIDEGWIHTDFPHVLTGIIYLTPNSKESNGTSLYKLNNKNICWNNEVTEDIKRKGYLNEGDVNAFKDARDYEYSQFTKTLDIPSFYNRLVLFDSSLYHKANNFHIDDQDRLTVIVFFKNVNFNSGLLPITKMQRQVTG